MPSEIEPGDIVRYVTNIRTPPRLKPGEILCHNHVAHLASTSHGINGFRYFVCDGRPGHGWKLCPCGWRPDFGKHYARPDHVAYQRQRIKAGKPLTMHWPFPVPRGFRRAGKDTITAKATP